MWERQVIPQSWYISSGVLTLLSVLLTQLSLFDVLGYESSFALGLASAVVSWFWGLSQARRSATLIRTLFLTLTHYLAPLLIMSLNALWVQNCSFGDGVIYFIALPVCTGLYVTTLAYVSGTLATLCRVSRAQRLLLLGLIFFAPLVAEAYQFLTEPTIFFFNHAWGWYAGSIYDEGLIPDVRLAYFRFGTLLRISALLAVLHLLRQVKLRVALPLCAGLIAVSWYGEAQLARSGSYYVDRQEIEAVLSERVEINGMVLHLDPSISAQRRQEIIVEHAYRLETLKSLEDGLAPQQPVHSYVYKDAEQKGRLMGGKRTMFAKPWLREIHIHGYRTPHRILGHELVHALLEPRADHPLGIPVANQVIPMMAWVEGFAEAFTPPRSAYDIHTYARWLQERNRLPQLEPLLSPWTFWRTSPTVAYPVMGSFIDFVLNRYGTKTLDAYRDGDISRALGVSVDDLEAQWHLFLSDIELDSATQRGAATRLKHPSLFDRPCARVIAALREEAEAAADQDAPTVYEKICDLLPNDPRALFDHARSLAQANRWSDFDDVVQHLEQGAKLDAAQLGTLLALQGERAWKQGNLSGAKVYFERALSLHTGNASSRLRWTAVQLLNTSMSDKLAQQWYAYLFEKISFEEALQLFNRSLEANVPSVLVHYLHGRRLYLEKQWSESLNYLAREPLSEAFMEAERLRLLREAAFETLEFETAEQYHQAYLNRLSRSGERVRAQDAWQSRLYAKQNRALTAD